ncbi:gamma-glutamylcyclotransferase family protein [uncultured Draconibacterium sp.]|uniref:gamma-glutamylcyclotransferase family protein n=1 Tax=uncultured Draconibacterium sp. TaxID=1573823 RepID=UPI003216C733
MQHIFVYGSLLFNTITEALCGKTIESAEATLANYRRFAVKGADYPAIIPAEGYKVKGKVLLNLDEKANDILNFYEGNEYERQKVSVKTEAGPIEAEVYIWDGPLEALETCDWNENTFKKESLQYYLDEVIPATLEEFSEMNK